MNILITVSSPPALPRSFLPSHPPVLDIKLRALCTVSKHCSTELYLQLILMICFYYSLEILC